MLSIKSPDKMDFIGSMLNGIDFIMQNDWNNANPLSHQTHGISHIWKKLKKLNETGISIASFKCGAGRHIPPTSTKQDEPKLNIASILVRTACHNCWTEERFILSTVLNFNQSWAKKECFKNSGGKSQKGKGKYTNKAVSRFKEEEYETFVELLHIAN